MEQAFDASFEDVRVHQGSAAAAEIGAQALTTGSDIHFAPGAPSAGPAGDVLLGHELAHVVQQRQGRVAATAQASGLPLSLDGQLEREADTQGARVARGERAGGPATSPAAARPGTVAQGKFGFEFQTVNSFVADPDQGIEIVGEKQLAFEDTAKKFKVEGDEGKDPQHFDVEFITAPLANVQEARTAVEGAAALADDLARDALGIKEASDGSEGEDAPEGFGVEEGPHMSEGEDAPDVFGVAQPQALRKVTRAAGDEFDGGTWKRPVAIEFAHWSFDAMPQASVGVALRDIPALMRDNIVQLEERDKEEETKLEEGNKGEEVNLPTGPAQKKTIDVVTEKTQAVYQSKRWQGLNNNVISPDLLGFLQLVMYYIHQARKPNPRNPDDKKSFPDLDDQVILDESPKSRFLVMARTDFHSMFSALDLEDRVAFVRGVVGGVGEPDPELESELAGIIGARLDAPLFGGPYRADSVMKEDIKTSQMTQDESRLFEFEEHVNSSGEARLLVMRGPTIREWLWSIVTGDSYAGGKKYAEKGRDMLSPPVGWRSRDPRATGMPKEGEIAQGRIYGMGAYPMDETESGKLAIFELRDLIANLPEFKEYLPYDKWWDAAQRVIDELIKSGVPAQQEPAQQEPAPQDNPNKRQRITGAMELVE